MRPPAASAFWQVGIRVSIAVTTRHRHSALDTEACSTECGEAEDPFQRHITGVTYDTRYDAWESGRRSWCQGAVQEIELVPKTEVGEILKLNRGDRPPTGQSEEALRFRCWFRRQFQSSVTKVPFSEAGLREGDFRLVATEVPFSEVGFNRGEK